MFPRDWWVDEDGELHDERHQAVCGQGPQPDGLIRFATTAVSFTAVPCVFRRALVLACMFFCDWSPNVEDGVPVDGRERRCAVRRRE